VFYGTGGASWREFRLEDQAPRRVVSQAANRLSDGPNLEGPFWSPSPDELAADASLYTTDEAVLGDTINRIIRWLSDHGTPVAGDY